MDKDDFEYKKLAIITFHAAYNYGAVLQAYALQEYLSREYGDTRIVDYHNKEIDKSYAKPSLSDIIRNPKKSFFKLFQSILYKKKNARMGEWLKPGSC